MENLMRKMITAVASFLTVASATNVYAHPVTLSPCYESQTKCVDLKGEKLKTCFMKHANAGCLAELKRDHHVGEPQPKVIKHKPMAIKPGLKPSPPPKAERERLAKERAEREKNKK